jgi:hypothetical protein
MKSQGLNRWITLGAVTYIALAIAQSSWSQEKKVKTYPRHSSDPYAADQLEEAKIQVDKARKVAEAARKDAEAARWHADKFKFVIATGGHRENAELCRAAEAVRDAKSEEEQDEAKDNLRGLLEDVFEEDMNRRKDSLVEMESRLRKLKQQLEQRREKMEDIVELQMQVLVNEANGLGFYSGGPQPFEVPIGDGNNPFARPIHVESPRIEYRPTPVRITAPRTELVMEAPTQPIEPPVPTAAEPAQPPAPPERAAPAEDAPDGPQR